MRKIISCLLACMIMLSVLAFSGCSSVDEEGAERGFKVYFSALKGFNISSMKNNVVGEKDGDIGFEIEQLSDDFRHSDNYKKRVEEMMRTLSSTFDYTVNSREAVDENTVKLDITMKYADVNSRDLDTYTRGKVDEYNEENFEKVGKMDDYEYAEEIIGVQADAYREFVIRQGRLTKDFTITVSLIDGKWKIKTAENEDFFDFLEELFVGNEPTEEEPVVEETAEGGEVTTEETTEE